MANQIRPYRWIPGCTLRLAEPMWFSDGERHQEFILEEYRENGKQILVRPVDASDHGHVISAFDLARGWTLSEPPSAQGESK